jgi:ethanolamine utilization protein EutN
MLLGIVEGNATSHIRHPTLKGWKLLIVQPLNLKGGPDGDPVLAIDNIGAGHGCKVVISNDGRGTREMVGNDNTPLRWAVVGIVDNVQMW